MERHGAYTVLLALFLVFGVHVASANDGDRKNVLVLHAYHEGFTWTDSIDRGVRAVLEGSPRSLEIFVEYMDSKRNPAATLFPHLARLYGSKYGDVRFDVIITSDDNAFDFILQYGARLFPEAPVVFCGVNNYSDDRLKGRRDITGIAEDFDIAANLRLIGRLQPEVRRIAVVSDVTPSGGLNLERFREVRHAFSGRFEFIELEGLKAGELAARLSALPKDAAVLNLSFWRDPTGRSFTHRESISLIVNASKLPVYTPWDHMVVYGTLGGIVTNGNMQGRMAADRALRILEGEAADAMAVLRESPNTPLFDYGALKHFGIPESRLPEYSIVKNRPETVYYRFRNLIWAGAGFIAILLAVILWLVASILRRKRAEGSLQESEERYRSLVDNIDLGITLIDREFRVVMTNAAQERMFEAAPLSFNGKTCFYEFEKRDAVCPHCPGARAMATGEVSEAETEGVRDDGTRFYVRIRAFPWRGPDGGTRGFIELVEDVTRSRRDEEEKETLRAQLLQSQKLESVGRLAGGVAHDFNNLLSSIIGYSELALMKLPEGHPVSEDVETIAEAGERAAELTSQLLAYSRKQVLTIKEVSLNGVVDRMTRMLGPLIGEDIVLAVKPEATADVIRADTGQIEQVIINLAVNARDAMPAGGRLIIETSERVLEPEDRPQHPEATPGPYVVLAVTDSGEGMSEEVRQNIFEPFFTTKEVGRGTGLGLATVHGIVRQHGGHIYVYSESGKGTVFKIYFPAVSGEEALPAVSEKRLSARKGSETVLVVDDEAAVRGMARDALELLGYRVMESGSAAEALERADTQTDRIDVLLTDVVMPGMNGRDLADSFLKKRPGTCVIYMSGYTENAIAHHGVLNPGAIYLQKPITPTRLAEKIREVLDG